MSLTIPIRVRILHATALVSAGLRSMLDAAEDIVVNGHAGAGPTPCDDVVITDSLDGLQRCQDLAAQDGLQATCILVVAQQRNAWDVRHALDKGAHGYVLQSCSQDELYRAVRELGPGQRCRNPLARRNATRGYSRNSLTGRETEVLQWLGRGSCNKVIAREMGIGVGTVKSHVQAILSKLNATARTHAVVLANQRGLIGPLRPVGAVGPASQCGA